MIQRCKTFAGEIHLKDKIDDEVNEFLSDGKQVIHMSASVETPGDSYIFQYFVTIIYTEMAQQRVPNVAFLEKPPLRAQRPIPPSMMKVIQELGGQDQQKPKRECEPAVATAEEIFDREAKTVYCDHCEYDETNFTMCPYLDIVVSCRHLK